MLKKTVLLLMLALIISSCKHEILSPQNANLDPTVKQSNISYADFLNSINLDALGTLKSKLIANPNNELLLITESNDVGNLSIYTDTIKKFTLNNEVSYVFKMALSSPRSLSFRNLTIFVDKDGKTSAFIATYTPTKEWVSDKKQNKLIKFDGDISITPISLAARDLTQALSFNANNSSANGKTMSVGNSKMLVSTICYDFTIFQSIPHLCSENYHWPWQNCDFDDGASDGRPGYYSYGYVYHEVCFNADDGGGIGGGGGGGGSSPSGGGSSPEPPSGYNPCDCTPQAVSHTNNVGLMKLALLPPTCCDDDPNYRLPPTATTLNAIQLQQAIILTKYAISQVLEDMPTDVEITQEEMNAISQVLVDQNSLDYLSHVAEFPSILNDPPRDDEDPFWVMIKNNIRRFLGIDQPNNAEEAEEIIELHKKSNRIGTDVHRLHDNLKVVFSFIPGYAALDNIIIDENYTSATINLSLDLFGGTLFKTITGPILRVFEKYSFKTIDLALKYPNIAEKLKLLKIREFNIFKRSNSSKIIIIGEDMENRVLPSIDVFNKIFKNTERFSASLLAEKQLETMKMLAGRNLTKDEIKTTLMYQENMNWIKNKLAAGYNVIDIGPKILNSVKSYFYEMERSFIYTK